MVTRFSIILILIGLTSCQIGLIPCPKSKPVRARKVSMYKSYRESTFSTDASTHNRYYKSADDRMVRNITVEEWDCPRPGQKKYMPRSVKENIKKNLKKVHHDSGAKSDSLSVK